MIGIGPQGRESRSSAGVSSPSSALLIGINRALCRELASVASPSVADHLLDVSEAYIDLGYSAEASQILQKLSAPMKADSNFHRILGQLDRCKDLQALARLVQIGSAAPNPSPEILRACAKTWVTLGNPSNAASAWATLIENGAMADDDWQSLVGFLEHHPDMPVLVGPLASLATYREDPWQVSIHQKFCAIRSLLETDSSKASRALAELKVEDLSDKQISLNVAICAFRLGAYPLAEKALDRFCSHGGDCNLSREILGAVRSFRGVAEVPLSESLYLEKAVHDSVLAWAEGLPPNIAFWGSVRKASNGQVRVDSESIDLESCNIPEVAPERGSVATFSVLAQSSIRPDAYDILSVVDLSAPHLIVQRAESGLRLHSFRASRNGVRNWKWEQTQICLLDSAKYAQRKLVIPKSPDPKQQLWLRALKEIEYFEEEEY